MTMRKIVDTFKEMYEADISPILIKIRQDKHVINKAIYLALGVNIECHKNYSHVDIGKRRG
jgi:transposase-like protein